MRPLQDINHFCERMVPTKSEPYWYFNHLARYNFAKGFVINKVILDVGCGTGYGASILADIASSVHAIDINKEVVGQAKINYPGKNLNYEVMSCERPLSFKDRLFDVVCSFEVIEHIKEPNMYLGEISRILKPGGIFIVSTPNKERYPPLAGVNPFHHREYTLNEFSCELKTRLNNIEIYGQRCRLKARQLYHSSFSELIYKLRHVFQFGPLFPRWSRELVERILTGHSIQDAQLDDFTISLERVKEAEEFVAVCHKES